MNKLAVAIMVLAAQVSQAQQCVPGDAGCKERAVVADLGRIVTPGGIQETYKTRIGGRATSRSRASASSRRANGRNTMAA